MKDVGPPSVLKYWPHTDSVVTEDLNHDGRPDVSRVYDPHHHLTEVFRDTNLDGQLDVREYYAQGALVRRDGGCIPVSAIAGPTLDWVFQVMPGHATTVILDARSFHEPAQGCDTTDLDAVPRPLGMTGPHLTYNVAKPERPHSASWPTVAKTVVILESWCGGQRGVV